MKSNVDLDAISDGRIYDMNDLVKADTDGCSGCNACCHGVGEMVVLNPYDVHGITRHLNCSFDELLTDRLELRSNGKLLLPHLKMQGDQEWCVFLNAEGRCSIHSCRPDICRLFPLGRVYEPNDFKYFLQADACAKPSLTKIKVKKWIGIPNTSEHKAFLLAWYHVIKALTFRVKFIRDEDEMKSLNADLLDTFYRIPPDAGDFYAEFFKRLPEAKNRMGIL
jgi:uncharacterized protein